MQGGSSLKKVIHKVVSTAVALSLLAPSFSLSAEAAATSTTTSKSKVAPVTTMKASVANTTPITVELNGNKIIFDVEPAVQNNRVMVPYRALLEAMGATVYWDEKSGTIGSTRNGEAIQFTLYSKFATVNGAVIPLDVEVTAKDGRTLVPLRFIGENFNGTVNWDSIQSKVTIFMNGGGQNPNPTPPPANQDKTNIYLNNELMTFKTAPLILNNRTYIPFKEFVIQMKDDPLWIQNGQEAYIKMNGASITTITGEASAVVNGETISTTDFPIERNGVVYASLHYITEVLGGTFNRLNDDVFLSIKHSEFEEGFLEIEEAEIVRPKNIPSASLAGDRRFLLSDSPENLTPTSFPFERLVTWEDNVNLGKTAVDHRVHGWHLNNLGEKVTVGITIENHSSTNEIEVTDLKGIVRTSASSWREYDVGLPIAHAVISGKLSSIRMSHSTIQANSAAVIQTMNLDKKQLLGFLHDFTVKKVSGTGNLDYTIRVVLAKSDREDLTKIKYTNMEINQDQPHPRGAWGASQLQTTLPTYRVGSEEVAYSISNGITDELMSAEAALGNNQWVKKNTGHYGVTYKVIIPLENHTGSTKTVQVRLNARGGVYNGAVKVLDKVYLVPILQPITEVAKIIDYEVTKAKDTLEIELMHSSGSTLPIAIDLITLD